MDRLKGAPALVTINVPPPTTPVGPSIAPTDATMIYIGLSTVLSDLPMTSTILPHVSWLSSSSRLQGLSISYLLHRLNFLCYHLLLVLLCPLSSRRVLSDLYDWLP